MAMGCWMWPWSISTLATGPALVVLLGQRDGAPVLEGRYPLPGKGEQVLAGDVDGDGADDLVVLGISAEAGEGLESGVANDGALSLSTSVLRSRRWPARWRSLWPLAWEPTIPTRLIRPRPFPLPYLPELGM